MSQALIVRYDPKLIEEAVFHAERDNSIAKSSTSAAAAFMRVAEPNERERLFHDLYRSGLLGAAWESGRPSPARTTDDQRACR